MKLHRETYQVIRTLGMDEAIGGWDLKAATKQWENIPEEEEKPKTPEEHFLQWVIALLEAQNVTLPKGISPKDLEGLTWS